MRINALPAGGAESARNTQKENPMQISDIKNHARQLFDFPGSEEAIDLKKE